MKSLFKKELILLLLVSFVVTGLFAANRQEYSKSIKKEFPIDQNGTTDLSNKYGKIDIKTWDKNRIRIEVTIIVRAKNEDIAEDVFDRIDIEFENSSDYVKAKTIIDPKKKNSWWDWGSFNLKSDFSINYEVFMPNTVDLRLYNKYGDVFIEPLKGLGNIEVKYGDARLEGFGDDLKLTMGYGNATVLNAEDLLAYIKYGKLRLNDAKNVELTTKYSKINVDNCIDLWSESKYDEYNLGNIGKITFKGKYGNVEIEQVNNITALTKYTDFYIDKIENNADFDLEYGSVSVESISKNFSDIQLFGKYTDYKIRVENGTDFYITASCEYAGVRYPNELNITYEKEKYSSYELEGYVGSKNSSKNIKARLDYGGLNLRYYFFPFRTNSIWNFQPEKY